MHRMLHGIGAGLASLLVVSLAACAPRRLLSGTYVQAHKKGVIELEVKTLRLADNHTFAYVLWSDDLSSSHYGAGTYQIVGRQLRLNFAESAPVMATAQVRALAARPDTLTLKFVVRSRLVDRPAEAIPFAIITAYDKANKLVVAVAADAQGRAELRLPRNMQPERLRAESMGFITWNQECAAGSAAYQIELPPSEGTPYAAGTVKEFRVSQAVGRRLLLSQGKTQISFERQAAKK